MKKLFLSLFLTQLFFGVSYGQFGVGIGVTAASGSGLNSELDGHKAGIGFNLRGQYEINNNFEISPEIQYFLQSKQIDSKKNNASTSYFETSINFHYNNINNQYNKGYVFVGPVYSKTNLSSPVYINGEYSGILDFNYNAFGFNVGYGVEQSFGLYTELKYEYRFFLSSDLYDLQPQFNNFSQVMLTIGYLFRIDKNEDNPLEE